MSIQTLFFRNYFCRRLLLSVCSILMLGASGAHAFTQCPPVGNSPGCAVLVTINPNGSLSFQTDSSVPPFDGIEDTLTGVLNHSGATVYGIDLTGNGIFALDGDGATSGAYPGPGTSFSLIDASRGTVNFDNALDDGASLWFSLEGPPTLVKLSRTVTLDPGHGGTNCAYGLTGATGPTYKDTEHALALAIGLQLQNLLTQNGDRVEMTRTTAVCPTPRERAETANNANTNIFVSIHFNGNPASTKADGTEVWYLPAKTSSQQLANFTVDNVASNLGLANRGTRRSGIDCPWCEGDSIGVLSLTDMSAVLVEVAFLSNVGGDEVVMHNPNSIGLAAQGLFAGMDAFFKQ